MIVWPIQYFWNQSQLRRLNIVMYLKNWAVGYDDISGNTLKYCIQLVSEPLKYLCNCSLITCILPRELDNVVPLFKSDDPMVLLCRCPKRGCTGVYWISLTHIRYWYIISLDLGKLILHTLLAKNVEYFWFQRFFIFCVVCRLYLYLFYIPTSRYYFGGLIRTQWQNEQ